MNSRMNWLLIIIAIVALPTISVKVAVSGGKQFDDTPIITDCKVLEWAAQPLIDRLGKDFVSKYCQFSGISLHDNRRQVNRRFEQEECEYSVAWRIVIPDISIQFVNFMMGCDGSLQGDGYIAGIPDCVTYPDRCKFSVSRQNAKRIAEQYEFEVGRQDWTLEFSWFDETQGYVWKVQNYIGESSGQILVIDSNTGEIYPDILDWGK